MNMSLGMQSMTSDKPANHNLQIQINKPCTITSLRGEARNTAAGPVWSLRATLCLLRHIRARLRELVWQLRGWANNGRLAKNTDVELQHNLELPRIGQS